ncbi:hypothetical protein B296_00004508 [Ensete ventricosum]|uniref:Exocyst complex component SEC5 n=1 Tax=Ensete ventricosum TaxID=4639 RepID=A0A427B7E0_ENSVE|nr:hypothetical protein B296_00004508 [Ensete ventricosum]
MAGLVGCNVPTDDMPEHTEVLLREQSDLIRDAAQIYLLNSGIQWGGTPSVKKMKHLMGAFYGRVYEMQLLIYCTFLWACMQRCCTLEYFETVLNTYFSPQAHEALKRLQGLLLEKACESTTEPSENPGHHRRSTRGSEDAMVEDRQSTVSPDDLLVLAQQYSSEILESELERTRLNIVCFMESSLQPTSFTGPPKPAFASHQGSVSSPSYRRQQTVGSPAYSRQRRK